MITIVDTISHNDNPCYMLDGKVYPMTEEDARIYRSWQGVTEFPMVFKLVDGNLRPDRLQSIRDQQDDCRPE